MKNRGYLLMLTVGLFCFYSINALAQCEELIWQENFDGTSVDLTKWNIEVSNSGGGNGELQYYTDRPENISVADGLLTITALKENYLGSAYTSARLNSKNKGDWKYGRFETRMKLPTGQGIWPAFWMLSTEGKYGDWPASGEIDIMEMVGNKPNDIFGTLHYGPVWKYLNGDTTIANSNDFHKYSMEWGPSQIEWFVDDISFSVIKSTDVIDEGGVSRWYEFQEKFYLILNLAVGGNWPGAPDNTTVFPQTLTVDYVKVYGIVANQEILALQPAYPNAKNVQYSISEIPNATYDWSVPAGATITTGQGSNIISVDWACVSGNVSVEIGSICGTSTITKPIAFDNISITSDALVYEDQKNVVFSVPNLNNTIYTWTPPAGATIVTGQGESSITANWGCDLGIISVEINNICNTVSCNKEITLLSPIIKGPSKVSENSKGVKYSIDSIADYVYSWSVPVGATIISGQATSKISVDFGTLPGDVTATLTNTCGSIEYPISVAVTDTILLCDHESTKLDFQGWSGSTFEVIANHKTDANNPSLFIGKGYKTSSPWSGIYAHLDYELDITTHKAFSVKILGPKSGNILMKLEKNINNSAVKSEEISKPYTTTNEWQELKFDFSAKIFDGINRITLFYDFNVATENYFYFDDLKFLPSITTSLFSNPINFAEIEIYPNPARENLYIKSTNPTANIKSVRLITTTGNVVLTNKTNDTNAVIDLSNIAAGFYTIEIVTNKMVITRKILVE